MPELGCVPRMAACCATASQVDGTALDLPSLPWLLPHLVHLVQLAKISETCVCAIIGQLL